MTVEKKPFETEVSRLLDIVTHALYSDREVFLRELVSNASDACDNHRYQVVSNKSLKDEAREYQITLSVDEKAQTLTVSDNGIGMNHDDMVSNLGTIARSGTAKLMEQIRKAKKAGGDGTSLIGQFGVGFYSAFMVADKVVVTSRKSGEDKAWQWVSDGKSGYEIDSADKENAGTDVVLYLKKDAKEYLETIRLKHIVEKYSDHISIPVMLGEEKLNRGAALWQRSKSDISEDEYKQFYQHVAHAGDDPLLTLHWKAEGKFEYSSLLFIPTLRPYDIFDPRREHHVKLYVKRVFITDNCEGLVPPFLRFMKGVVDSEDLPLNISREVLQQNPLVAKIGSAITKKVLGEIKKMADTDDVAFKDFWYNYGQVIKEGLCENVEHREAIFDICRFHSTHSKDEQVSIADYVSRMKEGQDAIYYLAGEKMDILRSSPQLEAFKKQGVEVLLLNDMIDEYWLPAVSDYKGNTFKSAIRGAGDITGQSKPETPEEEKEQALAGQNDLTKYIKEVLGVSVRSVRLSKRLTDSAVCLVTDEGDLDANIERLLKMQGKMETAYTRILEINPDHPVIKRLGDMVKDGSAWEESSVTRDMVWLLLDQARIAEGDPVLDPAKFSERLARTMEKGLSVAA